MDEGQHVRHIWNQKSVPIVIRETKRGRQHRVRLPYSQENRVWLQNGRRLHPGWNSRLRYWEIPKSWFNDFVDRALRRYGNVWIIQPHRKLEVCASACQNAQGHECQCSCLGANHGSGNDGSWFEVNDAFAIRWNSDEWACRLLERK